MLSLPPAISSFLVHNPNITVHTYLPDHQLFLILRILLLVVDLEILLAQFVVLVELESDL